MGRLERGRRLPTEGGEQLQEGLVFVKEATQPEDLLLGVLAGFTGLPGDGVGELGDLSGTSTSRQVESMRVSSWLTLCSSRATMSSARSSRRPARRISSVPWSHRWFTCWGASAPSSCPVWARPSSDARFRRCPRQPPRKTLPNRSSANQREAEAVSPPGRRCVGRTHHGVGRSSHEGPDHSSFCVADDQRFQGADEAEGPGLDVRGVVEGKGLQQLCSLPGDAAVDGFVPGAGRAQSRTSWRP